MPFSESIKPLALVGDVGLVGLVGAVEGGVDIIITLEYGVILCDTLTLNIIDATLNLCASLLDYSTRITIIIMCTIRAFKVLNTARIFIVMEGLSPLSPAFTVRHQVLPNDMIGIYLSCETRECKAERRHSRIVHESLSIRPEYWKDKLTLTFKSKGRCLVP